MAPRLCCGVSIATRLARPAVAGITISARTAAGILIGREVVKQKVEYVCECGRSYIFFGENKLRKCQRCGRLMHIVDPSAKNSGAPRAAAKQVISVDHKAVPRNMSNLDETWEYEYKFDPRGRGYKEEPFTIGKLLKKIWTLFSFGKTSRRF